MLYLHDKHCAHNYLLQLPGPICIPPILLNQQKNPCPKLLVNNFFVLFRSNLSYQTKKIDFNQNKLIRD
uniref:Putative ovule protein n=1 Tax=Solanum chacoense TaxID=4108 RepID=A0A0V0GYB9_SOLCH